MFFENINKNYYHTYINIIFDFLRPIEPPRPVSRSRLTNVQTTARRSKQAKLRAIKMRRMYENQKVMSWKGFYYEDQS